MALPPLVHYETPTEYRLHYERIYCRGNIQTFDGVRVYSGQIGSATLSMRVQRGMATRMRFLRCAPSASIGLKQP